MSDQEPPEKPESPESPEPTRMPTPEELDELIAKTDLWAVGKSPEVLAMGQEEEDLPVMSLTDLEKSLKGANLWAEGMSREDLAKAVAYYRNKLQPNNPQTPTQEKLELTQQPKTIPKEVTPKKVPTMDQLTELMAQSDLADLMESVPRGTGAGPGGTWATGWGMKKSEILFIILVTSLPLIYFIDENFMWSVFERHISSVYFWAGLSIFSYLSYKVGRLWGLKSSPASFVPVKVFLCSWFFLALFAYFTFHGVSISGEDYEDYDDGYFELYYPYTADLQFQIDQLISQIEDFESDREEVAKLRLLEKQLKTVETNVLRTTGAIKYIFNILFVYSGLILGIYHRKKFS